MDASQTIARKSETEIGRGFRRRRHRRRRFGPLSTLQAAGTRPHGAGIRGRHRRWRHLVLEPLPGRPVRFRKLDLRLLVLAGTARRMGLGGAFRWPARDRALPEPRRRQVRSAPRHPVQDPRHRRALPREHAQLGHHPGRRPALHGPLPGHRGRRAVGGDVAEHSRGREFPGHLLPHALLAEGAGQLRGQAGRGDRHRRHRHPDDHRSGEDGRAPDGVPAHAAMGRAAAQRQDHQGGNEPYPGQLRRYFRALPGDLRLLHPHGRPALRARGNRRGA